MPKQPRTAIILNIGQAIGIVYDGESVLEARRQFRLFVIQSKAPRSGSSGESVILFRNFDVIRKYHPLIVNEGRD